MTKSWQLFTNLDYYLELLSGSWRKTWLVFLSWVGMISLLAGVWISYQAQPKLISLLQTISDQTISQIPQDIKVDWSQDQLQISPKPTQPAKIAWPNQLSDSELPKYFLVFHPEIIATPPVQTKTAPDSSLFFLNPAQIWVADFSNQTWSEPIEIESLPGFEALTAKSWRYEDLVNLVGQIHQQLRAWTKIGLGLFPLLNVLINWWSSIWFSLIEAGFIWVLCKLVRWQIRWKQIFKLSLLIMPAATAMQLLGNLIYPERNWSFFHLTYWLIFVLINLKLPNLITQTKAS